MQTDAYINPLLSRRKTISIHHTQLKLQGLPVSLKSHLTAWQITITLNKKVLSAQCVPQSKRCWELQDEVCSNDCTLNKKSSWQFRPTSRMKQWVKPVALVSVDERSWIIYFSGVCMQYHKRVCFFLSLRFPKHFIKMSKAAPRERVHHPRLNESVSKSKCILQVALSQKQATPLKWTRCFPLT